MRNGPDNNNGGAVHFPACMAVFRENRGEVSNFEQIDLRCGNDWKSSK